MSENEKALNGDTPSSEADVNTQNNELTDESIADVSGGLIVVCW